MHIDPEFYSSFFHLKSKKAGKLAMKKINNVSFAFSEHIMLQVNCQEFAEKLFTLLLH